MSTPKPRARSRRTKSDPDILILASKVPNKTGGFELQGYLIADANATTPIVKNILMFEEKTMRPMIRLWELGKVPSAVEEWFKPNAVFVE